MFEDALVCVTVTAVVEVVHFRAVSATLSMLTKQDGAVAYAVAKVITHAVHLAKTFDIGHGELVLVKDIGFSST